MQKSNLPHLLHRNTLQMIVFFDPSPEKLIAQSAFYLQIRPPQNRS